MTALVPTERVERYLGLTFNDADTARATEIIKTVSGRVQRYCNRVGLTRILNDEITIDGSFSSVLRLPRPPVVEVTEVLMNGIPVTDFEPVGADRIVRTSRMLSTYPNVVREPLGTWGGTAATLDITYTHGLAQVPEEIVDVVLELCARRWYNPGGNRSQSIDGHSVTFDTKESELFETLKPWRRLSHSARV